jgi:hypothetical protein
MNEKEKKDFYIAMCRCCLISEAMKGCPLCQFNIGLSEQSSSVASAPAPISVEISYSQYPGDDILSGKTFDRVINNWR